MKYINRPDIDFSQHGTQDIIFKYFNQHPPAFGILVDVGAYGRFLSNTFGLLKLGWKGLLIEANPEKIAPIKEEFKGLDVDVLCIGIGDRIDKQPFYLHSTSGYDSFIPDWRKEDRNGQVVILDIFPLCTVLENKFIPKDFDLLSVDTEGFDSKILTHFLAKSAYRPSLIVAEGDSFTDAAGLFKQYGYALHAIAGDPATGNLIFSRDP